MDENHKQKLEEAIFVFDKILTYKTASALLDLKPQKSSEILEKFVKQCVDSKKVYVTYLIGGSNHGTKKIIVVDAQSVEKVKSSFEDVFLEQIYSVQKSKAVTWESIFNVDDFLYLEKSKVNNTVVQSNFTDSKVEDKTTAVKKEETKGSKKGISNFFNAPKPVPKESPKETKKTTPKQEKKSNHLQNMFTNYKPKEKTEPKKEEIKEEKPSKHNDISDDEDDVIFSKKSVKKRGRIIDDEEEEENVAKHMKADIFDSDNESEKENISEDEPDNVEMEVDKEEIKEEVEEKEEEVVPVKKEEPKEVMYEDNDGYFVTEKPLIKKNTQESKPKTEAEKKDIKAQNKIEKQTKKEVTEKLKKNTNQKTLFNFFQKK